MTHRDYCGKHRAIAHTIVIADTAMKNAPISIYLVEDHPLVRQGVLRILEREKDFEICGEADNANVAIVQIAQREPDIVILDITLEGEANGIDLIKSIRARGLKTLPIVLSMHAEALFIERALRAGARAYINKKELGEAVVVAIREVLKGELYLSASASSRIINRFLSSGESHIARDEVHSMGDLTDRELQVFELIGQGMKTGDIARTLNISTNTIEAHRRNIKHKLGLSSGSELARNATQWVIQNR